MPSLRKTSSNVAVNLLSQESHAAEQSGEAEVARLLGHPSSGRVGGAAGQVDAAAFELDEEEHVEASERDRLDSEEVTGEHARGLLTEELSPARPGAPRRRPQLVGQQDP